MSQPATPIHQPIRGTLHLTFPYMVYDVSMPRLYANQKHITANIPYMVTRLRTLTAVILACHTAALTHALYYYTTYTHPPFSIYKMAVVFIQSILIISTTLYDGSTAAHIIKTHPPFSIYKYVRPNNVPPYIFVNTNLTQSILIIYT